MILFTQFALANEDYRWRAKAIDSVTKAPIEGALVEVVVTDRRDNNKELYSKCTTDVAGACDIKVKVSSSIWSGTSIFYKISVSKDGYSKAATRQEEKISNFDWALLLRLSPIAPPLGMATQTRSWAVNEGPEIGAHTRLAPRSISEVFGGNNEPRKDRGKFETEEAFQARRQLAERYLLTAPINPLLCPSTYSHQLGVYSVNGCVIFAQNTPLIEKSEEGAPMTLSNAYDSRRIKRIMNTKYSLSDTSGVSWSAEFKLGAKDAEALDSDLMMAIEVEGLQLASTCSLCDQRERDELVDKTVSLLNAMTKSPSPRKSGWMDEAFRSGAIVEDWDRTAKPKRVVKYFIYQKSTQKLLYELGIE